MRVRVKVKSPVREYRPPGSVRGAPGDWRPYLDRQQRAARFSSLKQNSRIAVRELDSPMATPSRLPNWQPAPRAIFRCNPWFGLGGLPSACPASEGLNIA